MHLLVKTRQGVEFTVTVEPDESVYHLKRAIAIQKVDWQVPLLKLVYADRYLGQDDLPIKSYGVRDHATIHVEFIGQQVPPSAIKSSKKSSGAACLVHEQESLLRNPQFSDLTVTCGSRTWKCHRAILVQRCTFFKVACGGSWSEAQTQTIDFPDDDPNGMDMLLAYLYTLKIPKLGDRTRYNGHVGAQMAFKLGDKYDLPPLRDAGQKTILNLVFRICLTTDENFDEIANNLFVWVGKVWEWETEGTAEIQETVLKVLVGRFNKIVGNEYFQSLVRKNGDFAVAFFQALAKRRKP